MNAPFSERLWFGLVACAVAGTWIALTDFHALSNGDSLVPVLVSLQHWTPFYWQQDRFGMLLPLLTTPLESPFAVLVVQTALAASSALAAFVLAARWMVRGPGANAVGLVSGALYLWLAPIGIRFDFLGLAQPYGVSLALGLGAFLAVRDLRSPGRWPLAAGLLLATFWVNLGLAVLLLPLAGAALGLLYLRTPGEERSSGLRATWRLVALLFGSSIVGYAFNRLSSWRSTKLNPKPVGEWLEAWSGWARALWEVTGEESWLLSLLVGMAAGALWWALPATRRAARSAADGVAAPLAAALVFLLFVGTLRWLELNLYNPRYAAPALLMAQTAAAALLLVPLRQAPTLAGRLSAFAPLLLLGACLAAYGWPSAGRARRSLEPLGPHTETLLATRATHLAGNYWTVWPGIFHAHLVAHERGQPLWLFGITHRARPLESVWRHPAGGEWRIATLPADAELPKTLQDFRLLPVEPVETVRGLTILRPTGRPVD